ncbi:MAG: DsrH/TusB family sulfur metabolism protein [Promethearchaeota archaeon]
MKSKNSIVYLYGFSLDNRDKAKSLIKILMEQVQLKINVELILIHDGVNRTTIKGVTPKLLEKLLELPIDLYAVIADIKARGMDPKNLNTRIKAINYGDLVDILTNTQKIVSWM